MFFKRAPRQTIHLYTISWNEEAMLAYFFRHYGPWVDRFVFYDDGSTDQTLEILGKRPDVEVRRFERADDADSFVLASQTMHNHAWKESRGQADWVVITAVDEFLYAPQMESYLAQCAKDGVTAIPALGYQMLSDERPRADRPLTELVTRGSPWATMNKLSLFTPDRIAETNQAAGRHEAGPSGDVKYPATDRLLNLHYKHLSLDHTFERNVALDARLGSMDRERKWGGQYGWTKARLKEQWERYEKNAVDNLFAADYNPHVQHSPLASRWWRKDDTSQTAQTG